ncbi:MAG: rhamnan synthesis F family protein [Pseudomonadota bacterium]
MKALPLWKVKRELKRFSYKLLKIVPDTWEYLTLTLKYDYMMSNKRKYHIGETEVLSEVAIYLIYPVNGLLQSHIQYIIELKSKGVTPVVVSNFPLRSDDLKLLKTHCGMVIERPNIGYDFGGYRDAILALESRFSELETLYVFNDSAWMIDAQRSWFDDAAASGRDFCGATSYYGVRRYSDEHFREIEWRYTPEHRNFHYASYALAIRSNILRDPAFIKFWRNLRLSNDKTRTVRRGEIGLSQWVLKRGYSHGATCDVQNLDQEIKNLSSDELDMVARHLVITDNPRLLQKRDDILESDPNSIEGVSDRINIILTSVSLKAVGYALPYYTIKYRGFQFVKKSPLWLSRDSSTIMLEILDGLDGRLGRLACKEAHEIANEKALEPM